MDTTLNFLPNIKIAPLGQVSVQFLSHGIEYFHQAIDYVHQLPYKRASSPVYTTVLAEHCGTCSTKHALIAELSREFNVPLQLRLGIFMMDSNSQLLAPILQEYKL